MRILIVEDEPFKMNAIAAAVEPLAKGGFIARAISLRGAMATLEAQIFDFVILDMAIPSHTSEVGAIDTYSQPVGGLDVLLFLAFGDRPERVAILTQYPTVEYDRRHVRLEDFKAVVEKDEVMNVADVIRFDDDSEDWKDRLIVALGDQN